MANRVLLILGNQLFDPKSLPVPPGPKTTVFMREDHELCTHFRYHKHKILFVLSAMRKYARELESAGYRVHYERLGDSPSTYDERLTTFLKKQGADVEVDLFEIEDKFFETRIERVFSECGVLPTLHESPMFLTSRTQLTKDLVSKKKPFMKTFYEAQRRRLGILVDSRGEPEGGRWSFDEDNRKPLPADHVCPPLPTYKLDAVDQEVAALVDRAFAKHPGTTDSFWLPTDRVAAKAWARDFFTQRFHDFGPYEDALSRDQPFLHHSVLTPYLNVGLITPDDCVKAALLAMKKQKIPLASCEGFLRQIIGWREFIRGIYQNYGERQEESNFFGHRRELTEAWYKGNTGIPPLDDLISKVERYGYAHHIERLMVAGSLMLLLEVNPKSAYAWFMEMFIDSSDWVMVPNVFGMALFSDGGIFATKPYICGSNYYRKMGRYPAGEWQDGVDGLYWSFVERNIDFFSKNPRLSMMARSAERIAPDRKKKLKAAADKLRERLTK